MSRRTPIYLNYLHLGIHTGAGPVAKPVADDLRQVKHELVVSFELILFDPNDGAVISNADQKIATLGVEERGNGPQHRMGHAFVVLAIFLEAPSQRGFEFESFRLTAFDQFGGVAVAAQILIEQEILECVAKTAVVGDPLVEVKVRIDDVSSELRHRRVAWPRRPGKAIAIRLAQGTLS
jgi:hypothetical protein